MTKSNEFILITCNEQKIKEFRLVLLGSGIKFDVLKADKPELQSDDPCEIVKVAAKTFAEKIRKAVVIEDSGLFIEALKGFPGTYTKHVYNKIGTAGLIKLMKGKTDRKCRYKSAVGYCKPGKEPVCFLGSEEGIIAEREKGRKGWGQDPIFMPKGKNRTYGELRKTESVNTFRKEAIEKLKEFLSS